MDFILCHKDIEVLHFSFNDDYSIIKSINDIYNEKHIPLNLSNNETSKIEDGLTHWWQGRVIPASRKHLLNALKLLNNSTPSKLAVATLGLSLSDHYWIKPEDYHAKYSDINFYENDFSDDVGKALFGNFTKKTNINFTSPNSTSNGWLQKKWIIDKQDNQRYLIKGCGTYLQEAANEVIATEICKRLGINHVPYNLARDKSLEYSSCPDFIQSLNSELVYANRIRLTKTKKKNNQNRYDSFLEKCQICGITNIDELKEQLAQMALLDYLIRNEDRHYENFGFLRNPNTLEWQGFAPLYDNGTSLFCKYSILYINNPKVEPKLYVVPFAATLEKQILITDVKKHCTSLNLDKLSDIDEFADSVFSVQADFSTERKQLLCSCLKNRVRNITRFMSNEIEIIPEPRYRKIDGRGN